MCRYIDIEYVCKLRIKLNSSLVQTMRIYAQTITNSAMTKVSGNQTSDFNANMHVTVEIT